jgi:hypothetical protein
VARAETELAQAEEMASLIPLGHPILMGHHSEGRDRRYRGRVDSLFTRAGADRAKAAKFERRADGIEAELAGSIYSDDPDAVEALEARIAGLVAERVRITAYNASCRRGTPDLSLLDEGLRRGLADVQRVGMGRADGSLPGYVLSNLSGNISRNRRRLEELRTRHG